MPVIIDDTGGGDGTVSGEEADATFLSGSATLYSFSPDQVEQAQRNIYRADASGVVFYLVVSREALKFPALIATVAREWAATWNKNAAVPGVLDIIETEEVTPLGSLDSVAEVAIESTSGRSSMTLTVLRRDFEHQLFVNQVEYWRSVLDQNEAA